MLPNDIFFLNSYLIIFSAVRKLIIYNNVREQQCRGKIKSKLTSNALCASLSIQMMAWSEVALQERTMCSNLPSTGTAVLTTGGYLPSLQQRKSMPH